MNMEIILVTIRRKIFMYGQLTNVFKPIDIGMGYYDGEKYYQTYASYYFDMPIVGSKVCTDEDSIVAVAITNEDNYTTPLLWKKWNRYFYEIDSNYVFITDPKTLERCQAAFSDIKSTEDIESNHTTKTKKEYVVNKVSIDSQYSVLKKAVFGQDEPLRMLLAHIFHYQKKLHSKKSQLTPEELSELKPNILLIGTTGAGKTLMIKEIARLFSIPYCIEDATTYSETAYKGGDVIDMLKHLYINSEQDLEKAQEGILFIDEADKICQRKDSTTNTVGVQQGLLKIIEGSKIYLTQTNTSNIGEFYFDTSKLTVILSGAFTGLEDIILKRCGQQKIGFSTSKPSKQDLEVTTDDLETYGMISEMAGRISDTIVLNKPTKEALKDAFLHSIYSPYLLAKKDLAEDHIQIQLEEGFVDAFIDKVYSLDTGFRGLKQVFNKIESHELYDLENGNQKVLLLTKDKLK